MPGTTLDVQPLAAAMPATVEGPVGTDRGRRGVARLKPVGTGYKQGDQGRRWMVVAVQVENGVLELQVRSGGNRQAARAGRWVGG